MKKLMLIALLSFLSAGDMKVLENECEQDVFSACHQLARYYVEGIGINMNMEKGISLYKKACDGGVLDSCCEGKFLGFFEPNGEVYKKGCGAGAYECCHFLAYSNLVPGVVVEQHATIDEIFRLERMACDEGNNTAACGTLGMLYLKVDEEKSNEYFKKACDLDEFGLDCFNWCQVGGDGRSCDRAVKYLKHTCENGNIENCRLVNN